LGAVEAQLCLSHEDKGKIPLKFGNIADASREVSLESLSSPNLSANLAPMSRVKRASLRTDNSANTAPVPKGTIKVLSRETGT